MAPIETSVVIRREQADVFAYLTDLSNAKEWSYGLVDVSYKGPLRQGATGADTRKMGRKEIVMPWRVTDFDPPNRVVVEFSSPFPIVAAFSFRPTQGGTEVTCATELRPRGMWRLMAPFMRREVRKTDGEQFQKLKAILEGGGRSAP